MNLNLPALYRKPLLIAATLASLALVLAVVAVLALPPFAPQTVEASVPEVQADPRPVVLVGAVADARTEVPPPFARLTATPETAEELTAAADEDGRFRLPDIPSGGQRVVPGSAAGHRAPEITGVLDAGRTAPADAELHGCPPGAACVAVPAEGPETGGRLEGVGKPSGTFQAVPDRPGYYTAQFLATDPSGASTSHTVTILVCWQQPCAEFEQP